MTDPPMYCTKCGKPGHRCRCPPCLVCGGRRCQHFDQAVMIAEYEWVSYIVDEMNKRRKTDA